MAGALGWSVFLLSHPGKAQGPIPRPGLEQGSWHSVPRGQAVGLRDRFGRPFSMPASLRDSATFVQWICVSKILKPKSRCRCVFKFHLFWLRVVPLDLLMVGLCPIALDPGSTLALPPASREQDGPHKHRWWVGSGLQLADLWRQHSRGEWLKVFVPKLNH